MELTTDVIVSLSGVVVSLLFAYFPWLRDWFDGLDTRWKPLWNAGVLLLVCAGYLAVSCGWDWVCIQANAGRALSVYGAALLANMATFNYGVKQFKQAQEVTCLGSFIEYTGPEA
jgi:hypothetical protein